MTGGFWSRIVLTLLCCGLIVGVNSPVEARTLDLQFKELLQGEPGEDEQIPTTFKVYVQGDVIAGPVSYSELKAIRPEGINLNQSGSTVTVTVRPTITMNHPRSKSLAPHRRKILERLNPREVTKEVTIEPSSSEDEAFPFGSEPVAREILNVKPGSGIYRTYELDTVAQSLKRVSGPRVGRSKKSNQSTSSTPAPTVLAVKLDPSVLFREEPPEKRLKLRFFLKKPPREVLELNLYAFEESTMGETFPRGDLASGRYDEILQKKGSLVDTTTVSPLDRSISFSLEPLRSMLRNKTRLPWLLLTGTPADQPGEWPGSVTVWGDDPKRTPARGIMPGFVFERK